MAKRPSKLAPAPAPTTAWQLTIPCSRGEAEWFQLNCDHLFEDWETQPAVLANEPDEARPDDWQLDIIFDAEPSDAVVNSIRELMPQGLATSFTLEALPETDWITQSQAGLDPITAGPFHVLNDARDARRDDLVNFLIPASQAFGTGQHETTYGCLLTLAQLRKNGQRFGNIADIGTGTGLLAFAAHTLWPRAYILASDIDPVAVEVSAENAELNGLKLGSKMGEVLLVAAAGVDHPLIQGLAPYDLVIANILAGPLVELAPSLAAQLAEGGSLILAGLLEGQAVHVIAAYRAQGLVLASRIDNGDWPTLHLRKRRRFGWRRPLHWNAGNRGEAPGFGSL